MERIREKNKHTACTSQHIAIDTVDKLKQMHGSALYKQYARVMRYALNLGALRAASAGGREGRAACAVGAMMCCALLVHGRYVMYGNLQRSRCWMVCAVWL